MLLGAGGEACWENQYCSVLRCCGCCCEVKCCWQASAGCCLICKPTCNPCTAAAMSSEGCRPHASPTNMHCCWRSQLAGHQAQLMWAAQGASQVEHASTQVGAACSCQAIHAVCHANMRTHATTMCKPTSTTAGMHRTYSTCLAPQRQAGARCHRQQHHL